MGHGALHERDALSLCHAWLVLLVHKTGDVAGSASIRRVGHTHEGAADRNGVDLTAPRLVPASHDEPGHEAVLVVVGDHLEEAGRRLDRRQRANLDGVLPDVVLHEPRERLGICCAPAAQDEDAVVHLGDLPRGAVGDVVSRGGPGVGAQHDASVERDGHDGRAGGDCALGGHHVVLAVRATAFHVAHATLLRLNHPGRNDLHS
mmetsp:Transcript_69542/g.214959  ORF Transcript_69542/g.214959 Transcript_69542/m.214959 type:complete len:204 (+) Transcript_69542:174-785(+)